MKALLRRNAANAQESPAWVTRYWWAFAVVGVLLVGYGVATHARPLEYGGPISLGILLVTTGVVAWLRRRRAEALAEPDSSAVHHQGQSPGRSL